MIAGDVDYGVHGAGYATQRQTDARIAALVLAALGDARTVLNVGAGAGSYEPLDRHVIALEPSAAMRAQRPPHLAPAIIGRAEALPLDDGAVDASMAMLTVHQWEGLEKGMAELRRVTRGPIVVLTFDGDALDRFWLAEYAPEMIAVERRRYPPIAQLCELLGGGEVTSVPIPIDCVDGFSEAFYARPERLLLPEVRASQSAWTFVDEAVVARSVARLGEELASGEWDRKYGSWRTMPTFDGSLRLLVRRAV